MNDDRHPPQSCPECYGIGWHKTGCPAAPDEPDYEDMTDAQRIDWRIHNNTNSELAALVVEIERRLDAVLDEVDPARK